jgi:hypothetical protein
MNRRSWMIRTATAFAVCVAVAVPMTGLALPKDDLGGRGSQARDKPDGGRHQGFDKGKQDKAKHVASNEDRKKSKEAVRSRNNGKDPKKQGRHDNRNQNWKDQQARQLREQKQQRARQIAADQLRTNGNNSNLDALSKQRQKTKNEWRNIAILSGAVAVLGLIQKDNRLVFAGAAGSLYSLYRYEQDRKSQSKVDRLRASYFSKPYFTRNGRRYDRRTVTKNGQRYYQFVRR